jgi:branched-chain amino acid transport system substrate-binding protein
MKKKLLTLFIVVALVAVPLMFAMAASESPRKEAAAPTTSAEQQKTVKIGFLMALSGPDSAWITAQLTGLAMWLDQVNDEGGIEVGGENYLVELVKIDTENVPSKALEGAKKMILEDDVKMIMQLQGAEIDATAPFLKDHKIPLFTIYAGDIGPNRPYTFCTGQNWPMSIPMGLRYMVEKYPDKKRLVWAGEDYVVSWLGRAIMKASAEILDVDIVYDKAYSVGTMDFAPIADAIMATDPDIFSPQGAYVSTQMLLVKELYLRGYDGVFFHEEWPIEELLAVVPKEYIEDRFFTQAGFIGDPIIHPVGQKIYADWVARFGPGGPEDVGRSFFWLDWGAMTFTMAWKYGVELADSFDGEAVTKALENAHNIPHPLGPSEWIGKELWGINHALLIPQYITQIKDIGGTLRDVTVKYYPDIYDWFMAPGRVDIFKKHMEEAGVMWYQR